MSEWSRRQFLQRAGLVGLGAAMSRGLILPARAGMGNAELAAVAAADDPAGFSLGVASGDPSADGVVLWTRVDDPAVDQVGYEMRLGPSFADGVTVAAGTAPVGGDGTVSVEVEGLPEPGTPYWYRFTAGSVASAVGRTRTAPADPSHLRLAVTSCQDFQQGYYAAWRHIAARDDLDAVVFLGDYIYEYPTYTESWRVRTHHDPETGAPVGEARTLDDYRRLYRLYRGDADLRRAHRLHPFIVVWDDHEVAGDRWWGGAVNHGDDPGESAETYPEREAAGAQAFLEYLPMRRPAPVAGREHVFRSLSFGSLAELVMLDSRTFRSAGVGGSNRSFNPLSNIDQPGISDPSRTILGPDQKQWFADRLVDAHDRGVRWKLIGNQLMMTPLNLVSMPDVVGQIVAEATQRPEADRLPVTYHRDGIPVNTDQWDGYQAERRDLLSFIRDGRWPDGDPDPSTGAQRQLADLTTAPAISDVVFLTGDIHIGWSMEVHVDQGDAPFDNPVATEFVGAGISSENFNERIGMMTLGRPLPEGTTGAAGPAAMAANRHVRYVDFDANGYFTIDVTPERVRADHWVLRRPWGADLGRNPVEMTDAIMEVAVGGSWQVGHRSTRLVPAAGE